MKMEEKMGYHNRKKEIINCLKASGASCSIEKLCKALFVSRSTIRRDIIKLENEGLVKRHFGSVSFIDKTPNELSVNYRMMENPDKKSAIAKKASEYIKDDMVIFIDSSSTARYLMPYIRAKNNITVITNGIQMALELRNSPSIQCFIAPGKLKPKSFSIIGEHAVKYLSNFRAEVSFFSCKAINSHGIFEGDDSQALYKKKMIEHSNKAILLCDSTKENKSGYFKLSDFTDINILISDSPFSESIMNSIKNANCNINISKVHSE